MRGRAGRLGAVTVDCLCKLPEDVVERKGGAGLALVPMLANPTTLSRASAANDLLLLLTTRPADECECWCPEALGAEVRWCGG